MVKRDGERLTRGIHDRETSAFEVSSQQGLPGQRLSLISIGWAFRAQFWPGTPEMPSPLSVCDVPPTPMLIDTLVRRLRRVPNVDVRLRGDPRRSARPSSNRRAKLEDIENVRPHPVMECPGLRHRNMTIGRRHALGVPYEFKRAEDIGEVVWGAPTHRAKPGTWSDDGSLTLALLDSLCSAGFDFADVEADYRRRGDPGLLAALELLRGHAERKGRGWVIDSFWSAWDAFAGHETYRDAVIAAVKYGNDTDNTAAIAGGLAGISWGLEESAGGIPDRGDAGLRDRTNRSACLPGTGSVDPRCVATGATRYW
jgi:hypothetical protein